MPDLNERVDALMAALEKNPGDVAAWTELGSLMQSGGALGDAVEAFSAAVEAAPERAATWFNLGGALFAAGQLANAEETWLHALRRDDSHARAWCNVGVVRRMRGNVAGAEQALTQAVALDPEYVLAWANLAAVQETRNRPATAVDAADRALALSPADGLANLIRARLHRRAGELDEAADRIEGALAGSVGEGKARALIEAGMIADRQDRTDDAFAAFTVGQEALGRVPAAAGFDRGAYPGMVTAVSDRIDAVVGVAEAEPDGLPAPVFMVGFPRSGTTLTEHLLDAHPGLRTAEERPFLERAIGGAGYPSAFDAAAARQAWRAETEALAAPGIRLVDKFPLNLVHASAIDRAAPDGHLVLSLRDPRDVVLSCFMQDFVPNAAMVHFHSLEEAAALYATVMGAWLELRERLTIPVLEVRYEDLVADLPGQARRLVDFLGLPWDDAVLDYRTGAAAKTSLTPSRQDVTKPIFTRAAGRWRRYADPMAPVLPVLEPFVDAFGYER
ncbi:MAG: tetratricopeptide repeat protein [Proteobacteria bacterium]|nr:tetratricopeptide repeat protein [Pseudomonadota bacterium]